MRFHTETLTTDHRPPTSVFRPLSSAQRLSGRYLPYENLETDTWLDFVKDCGYLKNEADSSLKKECEVVGKMLGAMLINPTSFILKP